MTPWQRCMATETIIGPVMNQAISLDALSAGLQQISDGLWRKVRAPKRISTRNFWAVEGQIDTIAL